MATSVEIAAWEKTVRTPQEASTHLTCRNAMMMKAGGFIADPLQETPQSFMRHSLGMEKQVADEHRRNSAQRVVGFRLLSRRRAMGPPFF